MTHQRIYDILVNTGVYSTGEARKLAWARVNQNSQELQDTDVLWKSGLIQRAVKSRFKYIRDCKSFGWTEREIKDSIKRMRREGGEFVFLQMEYSIQPTEILSYKQAKKARARELLNRTAGKMGVRYGRRKYVRTKPYGKSPYKFQVQPKLPENPQ